MPLRVLLRRMLVGFCLIVTISSAVHSQTRTLKYNTPIGVNCNGFYEYLPERYTENPDEKFPLLIYFHGLGTSGDGTVGTLEKIVNEGANTPPYRSWRKTLPDSIDMNGKEMEFILITPQFINEPYYNDPNIPLYGSMVRDINDVINYCLSNYHVDPDKVYLSGQSRGAAYALQFPGSSPENANKIAAVLAASPAAGPATQLEGNNISAGHIPVRMAASEADEGNPADPAKYKKNSEA